LKFTYGTKNRNTPGGHIKVSKAVAVINGICVLGAADISVEVNSLHLELSSLIDLDGTLTVNDR